MAKPVIVLLVATAVGTAVGIPLFLLGLKRRVEAVIEDANASLSRFPPVLARLDEQSQVTARELDRLRSSLDAMGSGDDREGW